ncbi:MAG: hypothetical protein IK133_08950 [Clostridia bacterium]|nr:hypothetical protein [Clostridia bacterium]
MKPIHSAFHATIPSRIQKCVLLLLVLCLLLSCVAPTTAQADKAEDLKALLSSAMELINELPRKYASDIIGYDYYKTLPEGWEALQRTLDFLSFRFSDALTDMKREQYLFSLALTICAKDEKVSWLNTRALSEILDLEDKNYTSRELKALMELALDENNPGYSADMLEYANGLKAIGYSLKTLKDVCDACNQKMLLESMDWERLQFLAYAWANFGNGTLKQMGRTLVDFCKYDGSTQSFVASMSVLKNAGLSTVVDVAISESIKAAAAGAGFVYQAFLFGVNTATRLDVLTGSFYDMIYAAEALEACSDYLNYTKENVEINIDYFFESEDNLTLLEYYFDWLMCAGANYADVCAVMNETYSSYIGIAKDAFNNTNGKIDEDHDLSYVDDTMIRRATQAINDSKQFQNQADELLKRREWYEYTWENGKLPNNAKYKYDYSDVWVHHWVMQDNPKNTLDITRTRDGSLHAILHFDGVDNYNFYFEPYDYEVVEFGETDDLIYGTMYINAYNGGTLEINLFTYVMEKSDPLYDYVSHYEDEYMSGGWYVFTTDNPPDLFRYGGPMDYGWEGWDEGFEWVYLSDEERAQLFGELSTINMLAASGAGAWEGRLLIDASGNFTGYYYDEDMEEISEVSFSGRFGEVWQTEETTYYLEVASASTLQVPGTEAMTTWGGHITYAETLFPQDSEWLLTLPGTPNDSIPEDVQAEIGGTLGEWGDFSGFYTLTDYSSGWGFFSNPYDWDPRCMDPMPTATPVPVTSKPVTPAPVTATPVQSPEDTTRLPDGHLRYDNGTVVFEAPAEAVILPASNQSDGVWSIAVLVPCAESWEEYQVRNNSLLSISNRVELGIYTISIAPVQYYEKLYGAEYLDAESISKLAGTAHFRKVGYWSGTQMVASYTGDKKSAFYVRAAADETNLIPGEIKEYYVQLSGDRILNITTHDYPYDVPEGILDLFLQTLEIHDPLDAQPPAASRPAAGAQPRTGDLVTFGRYEQDNDLSNGAEPIDWLVLSVRNGKALILSQYGLDCRKYHSSPFDITWEDSATRAWLNSTFLEDAFTSEEQAAIQITTVPNDSSQCNSKWDSIGGNNTQDRIFLLSYQEAGTYFRRIYERKCLPTEYALAQGAFTDQYERIDGNPVGIWWLRSPGRTQEDAAHVSSTGSCNSYSSVSFMASYMIRPAMWVSLDALTDTSESSSLTPPTPTPASQTGSWLPTPPPEYVTHLPNGNIWYDDGRFAFEAPPDVYIIVPFAAANGNWGVTFMMGHNEELDDVIRRLYPDKTPTDVLVEYLTVGKIGTGTYETASKFYDKDIRDAETLNYTYYRNSIGADNKQSGTNVGYGTTTLAGRTAYYNWVESNSPILPATRREQYYIPLTDERYVLFSTDDEHNSIYRSAMQLIMSTLVIYDSEGTAPTVTITPTPTPAAAPAATPYYHDFPETPVILSDGICTIGCGRATTISVFYNDEWLEVGCLPIRFTNAGSNPFYLSLGYTPSSPMDLAEHDYYGRLNGEELTAALYVDSEKVYPYPYQDYNSMQLAPGETAAFYVIAFTNGEYYPGLADYDSVKVNLSVTNDGGDFWYRNYMLYYDNGYAYVDYGSEDNVPDGGDSGNYGYDDYDDYDDESWMLEDALYNALYDALGDWEQTDGTVTMRVTLESQTSAEYFLYVDLGTGEPLELGLFGVNDTIEYLVFSDWDEHTEGHLYLYGEQAMLQLFNKNGETLYAFNPSEILFERPEGFMPVWYRWYDPDWLGHWMLSGGGHESHMYITEYDDANVNVRITFDGRLEYSDTMSMGGYFDAGDFSGFLSMYREDHTIDLWDVWTDSDDIENWMAALDYDLPYTQVESYAIPKDQSPADPAPAAEAPAAGNSADLSAYNTVRFGQYEQDADYSNGPEEIEWLVLDIQGDRALLLSKYGLDVQPYHHTYTDVTWETCSLRAWLNSAFLESAFSPEEAQSILLSNVSNSSDQGNSAWNAPGGNDTRDKVFLLSFAEAGRYLNVSDSSDYNITSLTSATAYAVQMGAWTDESTRTAEGKASADWWLRSPGSTGCHAAYVWSNGNAGSGNVNYNDVCVVRPALWVSTQSVDISLSLDLIHIEIPEELLELSDIPISIMPVPTQPGATTTVMNIPVTTPEPTATPAPVPTSVPVVRPIAGRSDYLQVSVARVDASSYIEGKDPTSYMPFRMIDGEETTAFQFSTKVSKLGKAYIWFEFDEPVKLDEMWMKNGYWANTDGNDQYTRNSRVKQMTVWYRYAGSDKWQKGKDVTLKDDKTRTDWKVIHLNGRDDITGIQLQITDIYKGSKFPNDVCISEIMFVQSAQ